MAEQHVNGWTVGVGFDTEPFKKGIKEVEDTLKKLRNINFSSNQVYQNQLNKQLRTLRQQEKIVNRIYGKTGKISGGSKRASSGVAAKTSNDVKMWTPNYLKIERQQESLARKERAEFIANQKVKEKEQRAEETRRRKAIKKQYKEEEVLQRKLFTFNSNMEKQKSKEREMTSRLSDSKHSLRNDMYMLGQQLPRKLSSDPAKLAEFNKRLAVLKVRLQAAGSVGALRRIRADLALARKEANMFASDLGKIKKKQSMMGFATKRLGASLLNLAGGFASVYAAMQLIGNMYRTAKTLDSTKAALLASSGSAAQAAKDFEFVRRTSVALGTDLQSSAKAYAQLAVAGRDAGMSAYDVKELFTSVQEGATAFGMSADDASGLIRALTQSISKGVVQSEELKLQMGDRMPIAISTMAKALGVGNKELLSMMERGQLASKEVLPKFAKQLRIAAREGGSLSAGMNSIAAAENKLKTAWTSVVDQFMGSGGKTAITEGFEVLKDLLIDLTPMFKALGAAFKFVVDVVKFLKPAVDVIVAILNPVAIILEKIFKGIGYVLSYAPDSVARNNNIDTPVPYTGKTSVNRNPLAGGNTSKTSITNNNVKIDFQSTSADAKEVIVEFDKYTQGILKPMLPADY